MPLASLASLVGLLAVVSAGVTSNALSVEPRLSAALPTAAKGPQIHVNQTSITHNTWVKVTWSGVDTAGTTTDDCFIGVVSPGDSDVSAIDPLPYPATAPWTKTALIKFQYCSIDPSFMSTGNGSYEFVLLNMREDVRFVLFSGGINKPVAQAKTAQITFTDTSMPRGIVIALTGDPSQMRVSWTSDSNVDSVLKYGIVGTEKQYTIRAISSTYTADDLCGDPGKTQGWRDPGYINTAVISGLTPGKTQVWYQCGNGDTWSTVHTFTAAKAASGTTPLRILATADVGASEGDHCHYHWETPDAHLTYEHLAEHGPADVLLHIGDISYATGYSAKWDLFMDQAQWVGATTPIMTGLGNHEQDFPNQTHYNDNDSGGECGVPTTRRFIMPAKDQMKGWYSFDMGPVHFLVMDTELECGPGSEQYKFFEEDLASVNRTATPWIIFNGHRAMYYTYQTAGLDPNFQQFEHLLLEHKVDLALWGHYHNILRTCPVYNQTCITKKDQDGYDAPIHVCIGNGGMGLTPTTPNPPEWITYQKSIWGYNTIDVTSTTLHMALYADETNELLHEFTIKRAYPRTQ